VQSVTSVFRTIDSTLGYRTDNGLPPTQAAAEASIAWARQVQPAAIRSLVAEDNRRLRVRVAVRGAGFREIARLAGRAERLGRQLMPEVHVEAGGVYPLVGRAIGRIVDSQLHGLAFCLLSLAAVMSLGLWSARAGLLAQIPNLIPVVLMMGLVAWTRRHIDSDMLALPMIALGLAVDDTIHFLHRFRHERACGAAVPAALTGAFQSAGRAIVISTIVLGGGLLPLAWSPVLSLSMLGTYLVAGLAGAVVADLLCLPALLQLQWIRFPAAQPTGCTVLGRENRVRLSESSPAR
jgi:predicted RND superfamily exporter protein